MTCDNRGFLSFEMRLKNIDHPSAIPESIVRLVFDGFVRALNQNQSSRVHAFTKSSSKIKSN